MIRLKLASADVPDHLKSLLKTEGDDVFLETHDRQFDDVTPLLTAKEHEKAARVKAEADAAKWKKQAEDSAAALAAGGGGALKQVEASWSARFDQETGTLKAEIAKREARLRDTIRKQEVDRITREISSAPDLLAPVVASRLSVELDGDEHTIRVLDTKGNPTALKIDDLQKELVASDAYAAIIIGSKASGGGATKGSKGSGGATKFSGMSETERSELYRRDREQYRRLRDAEKQA